VHFEVPGNEASGKLLCYILDDFMVSMASVSGSGELQCTVIQVKKLFKAYISWVRQLVTVKYLNYYFAFQQLCKTFAM
jgi:hypothetical protein